MGADAAQNEAGLVIARSLARSTAVLVACLRRRLSVATMLGAAALSAAILAAGAVAVSLWPRAPQEVTLELNEASVFHSLPPFIAELKHGEAKAHVIQLALTVEVPGSQQQRLEGEQSTIEETIKTRLRYFDRRELEGNAGADRLRNDVLAIVNDAISPAVASRVLYLQFVID